MLASKRFRVRMTGLVQGVGFRPFLSRLATDRRLEGWVKNSGGAVIAEIEGLPDDCRGFLQDLRALAPAPSSLELVEVEEVRPLGGARTGADRAPFTIVGSDRDSELSRFIPVDIGICDACRDELVDSSNRRHRYPFINCCHCGPRFSIIRDLPYDRERTSMRSFHFCVDCGLEYEHGADRRFHAEPNACGECGPQYTYLDDGGQTIGPDAVEAAGAVLLAGGIVAVKGVGGFHLACRADDGRAVERLRRNKRRPDKPMAVMVADAREAACWGEVGPREAALLAGADRPIVLLKAAVQDDPESADEGILSPEISPKLDTVGVMLPYAPVHVLLQERVGKPIVYTSANHGGETIIADNEEAISRLKGVTDGWLLHDRKIINSCDDSIVRPVADRTITVRAGRGRAPYFTRVEGRYPPILACGADLKASASLAADGWAHLGPFIGDLEEASCFERYRDNIEALKRLLGIDPAVVACDRHPDYLTAEYARSLGLPIMPVQHHHAHIAAVMAERDLNDPVIGIAFDGLGWGDDGHIWGGEWLVCDRADYRRAAHLKEVPLPGGDAPARQPWRTAVSYLSALGLSADQISDCLPGTEAEALGRVASQVKAHINAPLSSSCGRMFEAVAAVCCGVNSQSYEGQAAALLEAAADPGPTASPYEFSLAAAPGGPVIVDQAPMFRALFGDLAAETPVGLMSARFHDGLARAITRVSVVLRDREGISDVVLAGGVFVNARLLDRAVADLERAGFRVHTPEHVPINDGGISFGQAAVVAARATATARQGNSKKCA